MIGDAIKTPEMLDLDSYYQRRMIIILEAIQMNFGVFRFYHGNQCRCCCVLGGYQNISEYHLSLPRVSLSEALRVSF